MKLTEFKNEDAIELLADILEPTALILGDEKTKQDMIDVRSGKKTRAKAVSSVIKRHKKETIEILARLDGKDPKNYTCNILVLPQKILEIINDEELASFFTSQVQMMESESFGLHTENTEESEK